MEDDIDKLLKKIKFIVIKYKIIVIIIFIFISIITIYKYIKNDEDIINISNVYKPNDIKEKNIASEEKSKKIVVHIDGQVINKGVYTVDSNCRLNDLVNLAGGLTENADNSKINLAQRLTDGEKIYIYAIGECGNSLEIIQNSSENNNKININTANKDKLKTLPGIGDATAEKIINYREENGDFEEIQDIQKVSGIGDSKYRDIEELICI